MLYCKSSLIEKKNLLLNTITQPTHHVAFGFLYYYRCLFDIISLHDHHNHHLKHHQRKINHLIHHRHPPLAIGCAFTLYFYLNFSSCGLVEVFVGKNYLHSYEN